MRNLVNSSLFTFKKTFDYQSLCDPKKDGKTAAGLRSVYVVSYISQRPFTHNLPHTHTHTEPPTCVHPNVYVHTFLISTHKYLLISLQERTDKCKHTCSHSYVHTHTMLHSPGSHKSGESRWEGKSRGYGESVGVGVAVTVTGLGGLACLFNTQRRCISSLTKHTTCSEMVPTRLQTFQWWWWISLKDAERSCWLIDIISRCRRKEIQLSVGIYRCKNSPR